MVQVKLFDPDMNSHDLLEMTDRDPNDTRLTTAMVFLSQYPTWGPQRHLSIEGQILSRLLTFLYMIHTTPNLRLYN